MRQILMACCALLLVAPAALADRAVTAEEAAKIEAVLAPLGCKASNMSFDREDRSFDVDDALCGDGRTYDMDLSTDYRIIGGERPLSDNEKLELASALGRVGCSGGRAKFDIDDDRFEVSKATCGGSDKLYELEFDRDFGLIKKKID
ncbi:MAG: hypothetical protein Kilf2KO_42420 [Rhodospirillales bacterium]